MSKQFHNEKNSNLIQIENESTTNMYIHILYEDWYQKISWQERSLQVIYHMEERTLSPKKDEMDRNSDRICKYEKV